MKKTNITNELCNRSQLGFVAKENNNNGNEDIAKQIVPEQSNGLDFCKQ